MLAALSAEASPDHLRGRYLSLIQLAWNLSGTIAPVLFAWLLERGPEPLWVVMIALAVVMVFVVGRLASVMPAAAAEVTNAAEPATT